ncbi:MAG: hypothetical protein ACFCVK_18690 [Acidimicrobiales bacterium]
MSPPANHGCSEEVATMADDVLYERVGKLAKVTMHRPQYGNA